MKRKQRFGVILALVVGLGCLLAACGSSSQSESGESGTSSEGSKVTVASKSGEQLNVAFVCATPAIDPYFAPIENGASAAASELGVNVTYTGLTNEVSPAAMAQAVQAAVNTKPDALIVCDFFPESENPEIERAVQEGIPVIGTNGEGSAVREAGGLVTVGEDAFKGGEEAGKEMEEAGVKHPLCVNTTPGNPAVVARCEGFLKAFKEAGITAKVLNLNEQNYTNASAQSAAIKGALTAEREVDGLLVFGPILGPLAVRAVEEVGRSGEVQVGSWDVSDEVAKLIEEEKLLFAAWQQQYLMGSLPVLIANEYLHTGLSPRGEISTGPIMITRSNLSVLQSALANEQA